MNTIFQPYLRKYLLVFFDDILIYSPDWETHLEHVQSALEVLQEQSLLIKKTKCDFGVSSVEYLGHIISSARVAIDPRKISSMREWSQPKTLKQLRGFLGLTGYYRRFIRNDGVISRPLTNLMKKDNFGWNCEAETAFETLKKCLKHCTSAGTIQLSQTFCD